MSSRLPAILLLLALACAEEGSEPAWPPLPHAVDTLSEDVPIPPGASPLAATQFVPGPGVHRFALPGEAEALARRYRTWLSEHGWSLEGVTAREGRFVVVASKGQIPTRRVSVVVAPAPEGAWLAVSERRSAP